MTDKVLTAEEIRKQFRDTVHSILKEEERGARVKLEDFWRKLKKAGAKLPTSEEIITLTLDFLGSEKVHGLHDMEVMMLWMFSLTFKQFAQLALVAENMTKEGT